MAGRILTIGHSNHDEQAFVSLLRRHDVEVVVDVRSQPYSKYNTQFNADQIKPMLAAAGIQYLFLGQELGGRDHTTAMHAYNKIANQIKESDNEKTKQEVEAIRQLLYTPT